MAGLSGARVLVTGATGFIGSHLTRRLVADGAEVHALTSTASGTYPVRLVDVRDRVVLHSGDLTDRAALDVVVASARPDVVFHLGASTHVGRSWELVDECVQVNVQGTVNLLQALAEPGYERFVYVGTSEIYGAVDVPFREDGPVNPVSPYSVAKYAAERYCRMFVRAHGWPIVCLRPFNAYGPWQSPDRVVPEIIGRALRGEPLRMTQGRQTREFNHVEDLIEGFVRIAVADDVVGEIVNLGCGQETSMRELATMLLRMLGDPVTAEYGALPDRPNEIWHMRSDSTKAEKLLGWTSTIPLDEGLRRTVDWYRTELARPTGSPFAP